MVRSHALLTRLPLPLRGARLACVKPAASVRSEPGSNSQVENLIYGYNQSHLTKRRKLLVTLKLTRTYLHTRQSEDHPGNIVLSKKRVRQSSFDSPISRTIRRQCRPRFSFFCIKLSKNRRPQTVENLNPLTKPATNHPTRRSNPVSASSAVPGF